MSKEKPKLKLVGEDGNTFFILGRAVSALRKANYTKEEMDRFQKEATSGDYNKLLATCMEWFDIDGDEDEEEE